MVRLNGSCYVLRRPISKWCGIDLCRYICVEFLIFNANARVKYSNMIRSRNNYITKKSKMVYNHFTDVSFSFSFECFLCFVGFRLAFSFRF